WTRVKHHDAPMDRSGRICRSPSEMSPVRRGLCCRCNWRRNFDLHSSLYTDCSVVRLYRIARLAVCPMAQRLADAKAETKRRNIMSAITALLQELEQESQSTRRLLERVPGQHLSWKPHNKSMNLGQLALHVARIPGALAEASRQPRFQVPNFDHPSP